MRPHSYDTIDWEVLKAFALKPGNRFCVDSTQAKGRHRRRRRNLSNEPLFRHQLATLLSDMQQLRELLRFEVLAFGRERLLSPNSHISAQWEAHLIASGLIVDSHLYDAQTGLAAPRSVYADYQVYVYAAQRLIGWSHELRLSIYRGALRPPPPTTRLPYRYVFTERKTVRRLGDTVPPIQLLVGRLQLAPQAMAIDQRCRRQLKKDTFVQVTFEVNNGHGHASKMVSLLGLVCQEGEADDPERFVSPRHSPGFYLFLLKDEAEAEAGSRFSRFYDPPPLVAIRVLYHAETTLRVPLAATWVAEKRLNFDLNCTLLWPKLTTFTSRRVRPSDDFAEIMGRLPVRLTVRQLEAAAICANHIELPFAENKIALVNGYPGTGKSTIIASLVAYLITKHASDAEFRLLLAAPNEASVDRLLRSLLDCGVPALFPEPYAVVRLGASPTFEPDTDPAAAYQIDLQIERAIAQGHLAVDLKWKYPRRVFLLKYAKVIITTPASLSADTAMMASFREGNVYNPADHPSFRCTIIDEFTRLTEYETLQLFVFPCTKYYLIGDWTRTPARLLSLEAKRWHYGETYIGRLLKHIFTDRTSLARHYVTLQRQFRMRPAISKFANWSTYGGRITSGPGVGENTRLRHLRPYLVLQMSPSPAGDQQSDYEEAQLSVQALLTVLVHLDLYDPRSHRLEREALQEACLTFAVLTLTPEQKGLIGEMLAVMDIDQGTAGTLVTVETVDEYEGCEADVVIFSTSAGPTVPHVEKLDLSTSLLVGCTRARSVLLLVTTGEDVVFETRRSPSSSSTSSTSSGASSSVSTPPPLLQQLTTDAHLRQTLLHLEAPKWTLSELTSVLVVHSLDTLPLCPTGAPQQVAISTVFSRASFFLQPDPGAVTQMSTFLRQYFSGPRGQYADATRIRRDQLYIARYNASFYRAQVLSKSGLTTYTLRLVDNGLLLSLDELNIFKLPECHQARLPKLAVHCTLPLTSSSSWTESAFSQLLRTHQKDRVPVMATCHPGGSTLKALVTLELSPDVPLLAEPSINNGYARLPAFNYQQFTQRHLPEQPQSPLVLQEAFLRFSDLTSALTIFDGKTVDDPDYPALLEVPPGASNGRAVSQGAIQLTDALSAFYHRFEEAAFTHFAANTAVVFKPGPSGGGTRPAFRGAVLSVSQTTGHYTVLALDFAFIIPEVEPSAIYTLDEALFSLQTIPAQANL